MEVTTIFIVLLILVAGVVAGVVIWRKGNRTRADDPRIEATLVNGQTMMRPLNLRRPLTIGRESNNDLQVDSHLVSRRHAHIFFDGDSWMLEDDDSVNGTFLNSRRVGRQVLTPGDLIEIGPARIQLVLPRVAPVATPTPGPVAASPPVAVPSPAMEAATSTTSCQLFGQFTVVRTLGEGGFSQVLLAQEHAHNHRLVALKILKSNDAFMMQKFRQEGALKLMHPHIARILATNETTDYPYIIMEYVEGISLRRLIGSHPLPVETALIIMGQVLAALDYAHNRKVIHRDIKPENIMVSAKDGVKLVDFGIAKVVSAVTRTSNGMLIGTPQYMSYEQAMGQAVNNSSDLYTAAIVLYELLTAQLPFNDDDPFKVVQMQQQAQPMPPIQLNPAIPFHVDAAILRAMSKDQTQRFASAAAFAQALGAPTNGVFPADLARMIIGLTPPAINEGGNASELATRTPAELPARSNRAPLLLIQSGPRRGQTIPLKQGRALGRGEIDPADGTISRQHFCIERQNEEWVLIDTSTHGTTVDGVTIHGARRALRNGTQIRAGQTMLIYQDGA